MDGLTGNTNVSVGNISNQDIEEFMRGTGNPSPSQQEAWGMTTEEIPNAPRALEGKSSAELELMAQQAAMRSAMAGLPTGGQEQELAARLAAIEADAQKFKGLYGQSENEKGALRQALQEQMDAFNALMMQFQQVQARPPVEQPMQTPQFPVPYAYAQPVHDALDGVADEDYISARKMRDLIDRDIKPTFQYLHAAVQATDQRAKTAEQRANALEQALAVERKAAAGITPADEFRLVQRNPWLQGVPERDKVAAMANLIKSERIMAGTANTAPQQQQQPSAAASAVRRITHIESNQPNAPDLTQDPLALAYQSDMAKIAMLPFEARGKAMREMSKKYGMQRAHDFGTGVLTDL